MDWMRLAVELTREAMKSGTAEPGPAPPTDLGNALTQQFAVIDHNMDAFVRTLNAHNAKLERALRRQRIWNIVLSIAVVLALLIPFLFRGSY
jgi:hypothetical protein